MKRPCPESVFRPGLPWLDVEGRPIEAHQGCVLFDRGTYCWYGADFSGPALPLAPPRMFSWYHARGTNVCSSADLYNWKREGVALANVNDPVHPLHRLNHVARPKVVRSDTTGKYVLMGTLLSPDVNRGDTHRYPGAAVAGHYLILPCDAGESQSPYGRPRDDRKAMLRYVVVDLADPANPKVVSDRNLLGYADPPADIIVKNYLSEFDPYDFAGCYKGSQSLFAMMSGPVPHGNRLPIQSSAFLYCIGQR